MTRALLVGIVALVPGIAAAQPAEDGSDASAGAPAPTTSSAPAKATSSSGAEPAPAPAAKPGLPAFAWQPYGYLRMQYIIVQNDPNTAFIGRDDGFELQNARIGVHGTLDNRASFTVAFDGAVDERAQNTPQGKLRVSLRDAYTDVFISGKLAVHAGYFQTWVDPQALVPDMAREFVDKPIETRGMRSTEGWYTQGLPPGRSLGAALRIDPDPDKNPNQVGFEVAVQNGTDEFSSNNDNDLPAVSASALFRLADHGFIVASGRFNPRTVGELPFRQDETDIQGSLGAQVNTAAISLGLGLVATNTSFQSTGGPSQNAYGAHAQVMFHIPAALPLFAGYRGGILDPSSLIVTDRVIEHTVGAMLSVPSLRMRVQFQVTHVQEQAARALSNDRAQLAAELVL